MLNIIYDFAKTFLFKKNVLIALGVSLVLGLGGWKAYDYGYDKATAKWDLERSEINKETARRLKEQVDAHNRFVEQQNKEVNNLQAENNRLEQIIKENESEASTDPNAKRPALGKSSVMRLNRIR